MCKVTKAAPNNFQNTAAASRFFNNGNQKTADQKGSTNISLGSEPSSSRFAALVVPAPAKDVAAGGAKKTKCLDQKGTTIHLGGEQSSSRFAAPPKPKAVEANPAGGFKKKKPAHYIDATTPDLSFGSEKAASRFAPAVQREPTNQFKNSVAAGSAKASGRLQQNDSAVKLGTEINASSRFEHVDRGKPAAKKSSSAGAPSKYGETKCAAKSSIRLSKSANASSVEFHGGKVEVPKRREQKTHTSTMSFNNGTFCGDEANSRVELKRPKAHGKGHASSISFEGGVTSTEKVASKQKQRSESKQHASSISFDKNGMSGKEQTDTAKPKQRQEHISQLQLGSDNVKSSSSSSIASNPATRAQPLKSYIPAGARVKSSPMALTDKVSTTSTTAPADMGRHCSQNYGASQIFF